MSRLEDLEARVAQLERRLANTIRSGRVAQVDVTAKRVRLKLSSDGGRDFLSPWVPYAQTAGALKLHSPPSVGQQMRLFSEGGDLSLGMAVPYTWTDDLASPSSVADEHVLTFGDIRVTLAEDELRLQFGAAGLLRMTPTLFEAKFADVDWTVGG